MKNLKSVKDLEIVIRKGYTLKTFSAELGISENELMNSIFQMYSSRKEAQRIVKAFRANEKLSRPAHKAPVVVVAAQEEVSDIQEPETVENHQEEMMSQSVSVHDILSSIASKNEAMVGQLKEKSDALNALELQHESLEAKRAEIRDQFVEFRRQVQELLKKHKVLKEQIREADNVYKQLDEQMDTLNTPIAKLREEIDCLRSEMSKSMDSTVYVYMDGSIALGDTIITEFEGWKEIHHSFYGNELVDELTGVQLKQLSKLLVVVQALPEAPTLVFEDEVLQIVFEAISTREAAEESHDSE